MARVAQGGPNPGRQLAQGRWKHPNAPREGSPNKDSRWTQDTRWGHVPGGGPKIDTQAMTQAMEEAAEKKRLAPLPRKVRDDLLPRDKTKHYGRNAGRRDMRRRKRPGKGRNTSDGA